MIRWRLLSLRVGLRHYSKGDPKPIEWYSSEVISDRKSLFQGHHTRLEHEQDVPHIIEEFKKTHKRLMKSASQPHMYAWRTGKLVIEGTGKKESFKYTNVNEGYFDNGEPSGGSEILRRVIHRNDLYNIIVIVTRWMHGHQIGPKRFKHIGAAGAASVALARNSPSP